jgi:hypothetical protein
MKSTSNDKLLLTPHVDRLWFRDELADAWRAAQDEAVAAYDAWRESPGRAGYSVYRAAQDRADQAQDVLAATGRGRHVRQPAALGSAISETSDDQPKPSAPMPRPLDES